MISRNYIKNSEWCIGLIYFFIVIAWSMTIAFHGAPDEATHFFLIEYLRIFESMPNVNSPAFMGRFSNFAYAENFFWYYGLPFPHAIGGLLTGILGEYILPSPLWFLGVRLFNWVLSIFFVIGLIRLTRELGLSFFWAAIFGLFVALIPQVVFVFSYFNSDAFGLVVVVWLLNASLKYYARPGPRSAAFYGLMLGLLFLAKIYYWPAFVFCFVMHVANAIYGKSMKWSESALIVLVAVIVAGPMLAFVYVNFGEITGRSGQIDFSNLHKFHPGTGYGTCYVGCQEAIFLWSNIIPWLMLTAKSYFSVTGWMNIYIDKYYYVAAGILALIIVGLAFVVLVMGFYLKIKRDLIEFELPVFLIFGMFPSVVFVSMLASQATLPQPQGRYIFVTVPFLVYLLAIMAKRISEIARSRL